MTTELKPVGVAVLLALFEDIRPFKAGHPGIDCEVNRPGVVFVRTRGYASPGEAKAALDRAAAVCHDGGLVVEALSPTTPPHSGFVVRRRQPIPTT